MLTLLVNIISIRFVSETLTKKGRLSMSHLAEYLEVDVRYYWRDKVLFLIFEEVDVVQDFGLPVHEFANLVKFGSIQLQQNSASQIMRLFVFEHLR